MKIKLLLSLALLVGVCFGMSGTGKRKDVPNSLGAEVVYENPFIYKAGRVIGGAVITGQNNREFTALIFQPNYTMEVYTEEIFLCGDVSNEINKYAHTNIVLTYRSLSHIAYDGVGCHELEGVNQIVTERESQ